jgi:hypothetical protein
VVRRQALFHSAQVHDRVEDDVGEGERPVDPRRREVADCDRDLLAAGLGAATRDHRLREVDSVHGKPTRDQRQRYSAGADPELQRRAVAGELGEEVDRRVDRGRFAELADRVVVAGRDALAEVVLG